MQYAKPGLEELGSIFNLTNTAKGSGMHGGGSDPRRPRRPIVEKKFEEFDLSDDEVLELLEGDLGTE